LNVLEIDHFVFGAADLDSGVEWMTDKLGAPPVGGGKHVAMSTHNKLWRVGPAYLEVIAIDPDAPVPRRTRWFGLDDPQVRERFAKEPAFLTWVARTDNLDAVLSTLSHDPGPALDLARDDLTWRLTVPEDGHLSGNGIIPHLIEWPDPERSPARTLPDQGIGLISLEAEVRPETRETLTQLGATALHLRDGEDRMVLVLRRPDGQTVRLAQA
jgi:catechol 2,3-dioxygenase-like lactoylglutathione lyase family enzyme